MVAAAGRYNKNSQSTAGDLIRRQHVARVARVNLNASDWSREESAGKAEWLCHMLT